jgi:exodeoxyribonuclease VII small subunit
MAKSSSTPARHPEPAAAESYEAALAELDLLVERMESAQLPLEQLLQTHQRGAELLAYCRQRLQAVQQQVQILEAGQVQAWPSGAGA